MTLVVVDSPSDWPLEVPGVSVISAREYLTDPARAAGRGTRVFNLCRRYRYQSSGYYVSLLAEARGHRPFPSVGTIEDLRHRSLMKLVAEDLDQLIQRSLAPLQAGEFVLSIYFGRNMAKRYRQLALQLYNMFPAPLMRARFALRSSGWQIESLRPIAAREIPPNHGEFVLQTAREHFARSTIGGARRAAARYDLAILLNPAEEEPPSDERAIKRIARAARAVGFSVETIGREDLGRLAEFDALFIRETTYVNHHTYRFARRAAAEGLVVIDDPESIVRCTNKVFLAEVLARRHVPVPKTVIVHRDNVEAASLSLGFPCILKLPDSSFSIGVVRADDGAAFREKAREYLEHSDLLIAQEFMRTDFDWRVGVLDRRVLYVCKYHMARTHWQILKRDAGGRVVHGGKVEAIPVRRAPLRVRQAALQAANLMGDGLYGVDLKEKDGKVVVIEVNDNPSLDAGYEDQELGEKLYERIARVFLQRVEQMKKGAAPR